MDELKSIHFKLIFKYVASQPVKIKCILKKVKPDNLIISE